MHRAYTTITAEIFSLGQTRLWDGSYKTRLLCSS